MKIKATCKYNYECARAATHANIFRRFNPKTVCLMLLILLLADIGVQIGNIILKDSNAVSIITIVACLVGIAMIYFVYYEIPKKQYKAMEQLRNLENKYFFDDEGIAILGQNNEYKGKTEIKYSMIQKAVETSKYLLLYCSCYESYVVDKSTLMNGTIEDIREKLVSYLKKQYIICRY